MAFVLVTAAFTAYAFVPSALSAHLLAIFGRTGIDSATVVFIGTLFGPAQVAARVTELAFGRNVHPLPVGRAAVALLVLAFALLALFGISVPLAAAFARDVRRRQRSHHHHARRAAAGAVRRRRLRPADGPHQRLLAGDAVGGAAGDGLRRGTGVGCDARWPSPRASPLVALACFAAIRRPLS